MSKRSGWHRAWKSGRWLAPVLLLVPFIVLASAAIALAVDEPEYKVGLDARQPFVDHDASARADEVPAGKKIITAYVAVGNRLDQPLPFSFDQLILGDENGEQYRDHLTSIWVPPFPEGDIAPHEVVGGYVSWIVPFSVWPVTITISPPDSWGPGYGNGWIAPVFSDVNAGYLYYRQIGQLKYRGAVAGHKDGSFRPETPVTRAQLAKILLHAASANGRAEFSYPQGYLEAADQAGLLSWRGGAGDDPVTRLEVAQTAARLGESRLATPPPDYTLPFEDIPASAREDLALLAFHEIVSGNGASSFSPEAFATRGQTAKIIALTLDPSVPPRYAPVLDRARENRAGEQAPDVTFSPKIWSPAETLTSSLEQSFTEALRRAHLVALFPSTPPPLEGQATGQFGIDQKFGGSPEALVVVRLPNVNPVVGVFSRAAGGQSLADAFPGDRGEPVKVRGQDGLWAPLSPHGTVVVWSEFGYHFLAESDGLELAPLLRWLDSWRPIPAPTNE